MQTSSAAAGRVLLADDQSDILDALRLLLSDAGYRTEIANTTAAALAAVKAGGLDLVLMDLNYSRDTTSGCEGLELLSQIRSEDRTLPVIVMTGWGTVDTAVDAMRRGARSFVQKPWENATLLEVVGREIEEAQTARTRDRRHEREHEEARQIQRGLMPTTLPRIAGCSTATMWQPAAGVGGDCFDVMRFSGTRLAVTIADVVGKGLPAALLMSGLQATVRALASESIAPRDLCSRVNRLLCKTVASGKFVTFCYCVIDTASNELGYGNAGHNPPILVRRSGAVERLQPGGTVLGVFEDSAYVQSRLRLEAGDRLVLFTDGITEVLNQEGEEYGDERLVETVVRERHLGADALLETVFEEVQNFCGGTFQDDATLIVVARDAPAAEPLRPNMR